MGGGGEGGEVERGCMWTRSATLLEYAQGCDTGWMGKHPGLQDFLYGAYVCMYARFYGILCAGFWVDVHFF